MNPHITRPVLWFGFVIFITGPSASAVESGPTQNPDYAPSFSCGAARSTIEHLTCDNKFLAVLDRGLAEGLQKLLDTKGVSRQRERAEQRAWLRQRFVTCKIPARGQPPDAVAAAVACLEDLYRLRIAALGAKYWSLAERPRRRELTGNGVELLEPLTIGKRTLKGIVTAVDIDGMLDERATNLPELNLWPPDRSDESQKSGLDRLNDWKAVHTCREWTQLHEQGWYSRDTRDMAIDLEFSASCETLAAIRIGRTANVSYLPQAGAGDIRLYSPVIVGAFPQEHSLGDVESRANAPLAIYRGDPGVSTADDPNEVERAGGDLILSTEAVAKNVLKYSNGDYDHNLHVLARGDFNGDGIEDFVVYDFSRIWFGTGVDGGLAIYTRITEHSPIEPICALNIESCYLVEPASSADVRAKFETECKVTLAQYLSLQNGMTYLQVRELLGCDGADRSGGRAGWAIYSWDGMRGSKMIATFENDRLIYKDGLY